ncbi:MAG: polyprenyl synthetase family protein [Candidatus Eremiobacteraeota bacterium]|nr:polyprenyl synthetase family protein [Candidatus Eremiobacteraeota bacterium]MBV8372535.1 polyprenyl synthetase family protein [Candidatus Eremiobacteraeota bacterium]
MFPTSCESLPLGEHRARLLEYLRAIGIPVGSVAGTIIAERRQTDDDRLLLRPNLVLWACGACGGAHDARADALAVAAAFDLFDRFIRLHDELVDVDERAPRERAKGMLVARWGLGQSLNAGDALYAMALRALAQDVRDAERRLRVAALVTGAVLEAIEGRTQDLERGTRGPHARDGLLARVRSVRRRSAALTGAALEAGALLAGARVRVCRAFNRAGRLLAAAAEGDDTILAERLATKAIACVERYLHQATFVEEFRSVARHVAIRTA